MAKQKTYIITNQDRTFCVEGERIRLGVGYEFFIHKKYNGDLYNISEKTSGCSFIEDQTKEQAILSALMVTRYYRKRHFKKAINKAIKINRRKF